MRNRLIHFVTVAVLLVATPRLVQSQQNDATSPDTESSKKAAEVSSLVSRLAAPAPKHFYRLNFVLRETDEGKVLNQRGFIMSVSADPADSHERNRWNLRAGTRLPVRDPNGTNFVDVGVNLDVWAQDADNGLQMEVTSEISSVATESATGGAPPIRQVKVRGAVFAPLGKSTMVFTAEDPASRHQFELQVTPVREK
jgi:hypothetical protein